MVRSTSDLWFTDDGSATYLRVRNSAVYSLTNRGLQMLQFALYLFSDSSQLEAHNKAEDQKRPSPKWSADRVGF